MGSLVFGDDFSWWYGGSFWFKKVIVSTEWMFCLSKVDKNMVMKLRQDQRHKQKKNNAIIDVRCSMFNYSWEYECQNKGRECTIAYNNIESSRSTSLLSYFIRFRKSSLIRILFNQQSKIFMYDQPLQISRKTQHLLNK